MEIRPETVTDKHADWPTTFAISKAGPRAWQKQSEKQKQSSTNESNTVESFIGVLQILEDLTHDKLNVS